MGARGLRSDDTYILSWQLRAREQRSVCNDGDCHLSGGYLDPGIREVVRRLRAAGFDTCDSGDGKSKPKVGRNLDEPHVFMKVDTAEMVAEAHRLAEFVGALQLPRKFQTRKLQPIVQLTYDPRDKSANLAFIGVGDKDLPKEKP